VGEGNDCSEGWQEYLLFIPSPYLGKRLNNRRKPKVINYNYLIEKLPETIQRGKRSTRLQIGLSIVGIIMARTRCIIKRRAEFSASHRYWLPELSEAENLSEFGACAYPMGHGHNYTLLVSMVGEIGDNGMVLNLSEVKHIIAREIISQLNFRYLNHAWEEFTETLPTTENLARVIWHRLAPHLPLTNIRIYEHPKLWADYQGKSMEAHLTVSSHFAAAHRLAMPHLSLEENTAIYGKCARPNGHGHNYLVDITVKGEIDRRTGMIVDLEQLQQTIDRVVLEPMDHTFLNYDLPYFKDVVPTAENIAAYILRVLKPAVAQLGVQIYSVKLTESPNNSCEVFDQPDLSSVPSL
jgi:6-pyruvoyltetrahydropterin/6-carboxytetrahydropterin synthase